MGGIILSLVFAIVVAFVALTPKGTAFSKKQLDSSKQEIKKLSTSKIA